MKRNKLFSSNRAITLIALIITIIIMLILVAVTVEVVINSNLFEIAQNAGDRTETAHQEEGNLSKVTIEGKEYNSVEEYQIQKNCSHEYVTEITKSPNCSETGIKKTTCTKCGKVEEEVIAKTQEHIIQNGECINCGQKHEFVLGATIVGYDPSVGASGTISTSYTSKKETTGFPYSDAQTFTVKSITQWQVLGEEDGQLIITPTLPILTAGGSSYGLNGQAGYNNVVEELENISSIYGQGKYADTSKYSVTLENQTIASGARSIKLEDIGCTINDYPTTKTYTKNADDGYIYTNGSKSSKTKFIYWGEDASPSQGAEWKTLGEGESVTIASYGYSKGTWTTKQKSMIEGENCDLSYHIANYYINVASGYVRYGIYECNYGLVVDNSNNVFYASYGSDSIPMKGIRPVVYLKSDIQLVYNSATEVYTIVE